MKFISIDKTILDYTLYKRDVSTLSKVIGLDTASYLNILGFDIIKRTKTTYASHKFSFYHQDLDLDIELVIKKRSPEVFV